MREFLEAYARTGGVPTLTEFARLTPEEQEILTTAIRSERVKLLAELAIAMGNGHAAAVLFAEIDGGSALQKAEIVKQMNG